MSLTEIRNYAAVRERLRNPPNPVRDDGIDLKRDKFRVVPIQVEGVALVPSSASQLEQTMIESRELARQLADALKLIAKLEATVAKLKEQREIVEDEITPRPSISLIQKIVAKHYGISQRDVLTSVRTARLVRVRHVAIYLCRDMTLKSLPDIGSRFAGRDHTTVLHACRKIDTQMKYDADLAEEVTGLRAKITAAMAIQNGSIQT